MSNIKKLMMASAGGPEGAWDLSYAYYDPPEGLTWNLSTAVYASKSLSVAARETNPYGISFKPDGTKLYVLGTAGDDVNEYNLSTAWDVSTASYLQVFSIAAQETIPTGLFFKPDGLKMYVIGQSGTDVNEYDLSSAWNVSTASYLQNFSVSAQETQPYGISFKSDGTKMYILGTSGVDVNEYDLSSAWDVSTASYLQNFSVSAQELNPLGLFFKPDGTKMYVSGAVGGDVNEYDLSTPWDVSSASYLQNFSVVAQDQNNPGLFFKPDGTAFYYVGNTNDTVYQYTLGGFSVAAQETSSTGIVFKPDGTKMYVTGTVGDDVNEYDLSTAWDLSSASYLQNFSVASQETAPRGMSFKPDGTKMYVVGSTADSVLEYDLSSAWDVSTASYLQGFSVSAQDTVPMGLFFRGDGLKMYVLGGTGLDVNEYDLSSAWNVSTASFVQNFSISAQESSPQDLFFKSDGTKMYITGQSGDDVNEYNLSTAWDVSTAVYSQAFSLLNQDINPTGFFFKGDGTQMFVGFNSELILSYTLGVQP